MNKLRRLIRKDWRLIRTPLVGLVLAGAIPYLLGMALFLLQWLGQAGVSNFALGRSFAMWMAASASWALALTAVVASVFGAVSFTQERRDRSAEFLAMMPVRRAKIIASKLIVLTVCLIVATGIHFSIQAVAVKYQDQLGPYTWPHIAHFYFGCIALFGIAWLFSTFLSSPAIAASISLATVLGSMSYTVVVMNKSYAPGPEVLMGALAAGLLALGFGTAYYMRRVAP